MILKQKVLLPIALILLALYVLSFATSATKASAPSGLRATQAIATTTTVGPGNSTQLFPANTSCAARILATQAQPIMVIVADTTNGDISSTTLSQTKGLLQAASTTQAYDSGIYGCGRMFGYAAASTTITAIETR